MLRLSIVLFLFCTFIVTNGGCSRRPSGMPDVFPCTVTVKNGGVPVDKALVTLYLEDGQGAMRIAGVTDSAGSAKIETRLIDYKAAGAPSGSYKVAIFKNPEIPDDGVDVTRLPEAEQQQRSLKQAEFEADNRIVPETLTSLETSPLRCVVKEKEGGSLVVDLAEFAK